VPQPAAFDLIAAPGSWNFTIRVDDHYFRTGTHKALRPVADGIRHATVARKCPRIVANDLHGMMCSDEFNA
jgi:hypothetical protein